MHGLDRLPLFFAPFKSLSASVSVLGREGAGDQRIAKLGNLAASDPALIDGMRVAGFNQVVAPTYCWRVELQTTEQWMRFEPLDLSAGG